MRISSSALGVVRQGDHRRVAFVVAAALALTEGAKDTACVTAQKEYKDPVPRKIRDLLKDLRKAGFSLVSGGKGSHRKFSHPQVMVPAIISGKDGDDAKPYLEKHVAEKIDESRS